MAISTVVYLYTRDAQNRLERVPIWVAPAAFGATTLPTAAHIQAVVDGAFGDPAGPTDGPSTSLCYAYGVEVIEDSPTNSGSRDGLVATPIALKTRNGIGVAGRDGKFGFEGLELRIPGYDLGFAAINPQDRNMVSMTDTRWAALRAALVAIGYRDPNNGHVFSSGETLETGLIFNGKRSPAQPR